MFLVVGIAFAWGATTYNIGEGARMGPGYFPLVLGILLAAIGAFTIFEALVVETEDGEPVGKYRLEAAGLHHRLQRGVRHPAGRPAHASAFPPFGLIVGIYALVFIAAWPATSSSCKEVLVLATILAVGSYLAFIVLLKLQFPVWPSFITG